MDEETFAFGSFRLIPAQRVLLDDGKPLRLGSRALDILIALVEGAGETVHKDQLIARTWPDTVVDDGALRVHVAALRKALGDGRAGRRYVANNAGRGYAFVAPVIREHPPPATAPPNSAAESNNLPAPLTRIVGRDDVIAALATQLARRRFLTIDGDCHCCFANPAWADAAPRALGTRSGSDKEASPTNHAPSLYDPRAASDCRSASPPRPPWSTS